jgi:16S rRNA G527 N7-methylase RsmG
VRLIEPRKRRAAFLEECLRRLELPGEVLAISAQEAAADPGCAAAHSFVVARALALPDQALELILPLTAPGGIAAVFLGASAKIPSSSEEFAPGIAIVRAR